jgi:hypothetical protein
MQYGHLRLRRSRMEGLGVVGLEASNEVSLSVPEGCGLTHANVAVRECRQLSVMLSTYPTH